MTVKELIEKLQGCDPTRIVVVPGYESGYDDVNYVFQAELRKDAKISDVDGTYQEPDEREADTAVICIDVNDSDMRPKYEVNGS